MDAQKKKITISFILSAVFFALFLAFTVIVKFVDIAPIGVFYTNIGLSTVNKFFFDLLGRNDIFYNLTQIVGYVVILTAVFLCFIGLVQLIKRKNLFKVSHRILCLCPAYALMVIVFVVFENLFINYRPILIDNVLEYSYPSTHTMLVACITFTAIPELCAIFKNNKIIKKIIICICVILTLFTAAGRVIAGVHWFSDVCASLLVSGAIVSFYYGLLALVEAEKAPAVEDPSTQDTTKETN